MPGMRFQKAKQSVFTLENICRARYNNPILLKVLKEPPMRTKKTAAMNSLSGLSEDLLLLPALLKRKLIHIDQLEECRNLSHSQLSILALLYRHRTLSVSEISRRLNLAKPNITPVVDRLCLSGLVTREHDLQDRRVVNVTLSPEGSAFLEQIYSAFGTALREQTKTISSADLLALCKSIDRLRQILEKL